MDRLKKTLIDDEGIVHEIYLDSRGYKTFGIGHLITPADREYGMPVGTPVSDERVSSAFQQDVNNAVRDTIKLLGADYQSLPVEVREILINMMFNLGRTKLAKFTRFLAAIREHDWEEAAKEGRDSLWYEQVTNRAERLMTRLESLA